MKASETLVTGLLKNGDTQFQVPLYQRPYSWTRENCEVLWTDILDQIGLVRDGIEEVAHFLGAVVLTPGIGDQASFRRYLVIDGQQRLTTLSLIMAAIRDNHKTDSGEINRIHKQYLINEYRNDNDSYRVLPTQIDRDVYQSIIRSDAVVKDPDSLLYKAHNYFRQRIASAVKDGYTLDEIETAVTTRLSLVDVTTNKNENPHRIFESLNNKGKQLTQADLIRNHVFMMLESDGERVYTNSWTPLAEMLSAKHLENLMWLKLVLDGDRRARIKDLYLHQQRWFEKNGQDVERYVKDLIELASSYRRMLEPELEPHRGMRTWFQRFNEWRSGAAHPVILAVLTAYDRGEIKVEEAEQGFRLIEGFMLRRAIIGKHTNGLSRIFQSVGADLSHVTSGVLISNLHTLLSAPSRSWASDHEIRESMPTLKLNPTNSGVTETRRYILKRLEESYGHPEPVDYAAESFTVEHIMPQTPTGDWLAALKPSSDEKDARDVHRRLLHTIGNLTLTTQNSKLSNKMFERKRQIYETSHLEMNREIAAASVWDEHEIIERGKRLAERAVQLWPGPLHR